MDSENVPGSEPSAAPAPDAAAEIPTTSSPTSEPANSPTEGLPEWEPLTPELVENEAIRGDFMLRWAVVLLALLMGCRQIVETTTLVHVKTGQYLAAHGFWPPAKDVFSATATEHRWVNLSWLWDLIASGLFSFGEGIGLSLATAILVAVTWWLLGKTSRANVSNWWGSILGALTLLACHYQFSGQPETVTLFGLAATLWCLQTWRFSADHAASASVVAMHGRPLSLWWLLPGFALWSNLDNRMFLGLTLLLLWGIGEAVGNALGRGALTTAQRKQFWTVLGTCVVASFLNPFGEQSLWSAVMLYGTEYPAWRNYAAASVSLEDNIASSLFTPALWSSGPWRLPLIAGVVVLASALVSLALNARRANLGDVFAFVGFVALACVAFHELAAASIVACAFGTVNAQQWYQAKFRQTYSIATSELLFTRGGRAVTVLAFFALAVMSINQSLFGSDGKRVGMGLSQRLRALVDAYRSATADSLDDRPFNFVHRQGDVLLWIGQKPFVDSRLTVFAGHGEEDLLAQHDRARRLLTGLPVHNAEANDNADWRPILDRFQITHALPRLVNARPISYFRMLTSAEWRLTHLGANCAVFYRQDASSPDLEKFLAAHRLQFEKVAFQTEEPGGIRTEWPRARTTWQKYLGPPEARVSNKVWEAENLLVHLQAMASGQLSIDPPTAVAIALLTIRRANDGLTESTDDATAYRALGDAYSFLFGIETEIEKNGGISFSNQLRFYQALGAYHQAALLEPNSLDLRNRLVDLLQQQNRIDLVLRELQEIKRLTPKSSADDQADDELWQRRLQLEERCQSQVDELREQLEKALDEGQNPLALAQQVYGAGFVLEALKLLDQDRKAVSQSPAAHALQGLLRFEAGEIEEAYRQFEFESESNQAAWRLPAAWTRLAHGEQDKAIALWKAQAGLSQAASLTTVLTSLPLIQSPFQQMGQPNVWPTQHALYAVDAQMRTESEVSTLLWYTAMSQLEWGQPQLAAKTLSGVLEAYPSTAFRPLIRFYLRAITDEVIDAEPPSEWIPIDGEMFAPDETPDSEKK